MWLLDTTTLELREFQSTPPPYAILSHTWTEEEVTFQELKDFVAQKDGTTESINKAGYAKIEKCCEQARSDGLTYAWVDTCCIDKRSSAELSEAINSMFRWYAEAQLCYAHLADVSTLGADPTQPHKHATASYPRAVWGFPSSRYFLRSWTLQEMIAPMHVVFFDKNWLEIGTKASLLDDLVEITGIPSKALMQPLTIRHHSVAERMSWASKRQATRVEDQAYSLLGIFGVNMPLLYGEGKKAFNRLQRQILSESNDHSIFAWTNPDSGSSYWEACSVLAESPHMFATEHTGRVTRYEEKDRHLPMYPINITNLGLSMTIPIIADPKGSFMAILNCLARDKRVAIYVTGSPTSSQRYRCQAQELVYLDLDFSKTARIQTVYMMTDMPDLPVDPGTTHIDLSVSVRSKQHGWSTIYCCKSQRRQGDTSIETIFTRTLWPTKKDSIPRVNTSIDVEDGSGIANGVWRSVSFVGADGHCFTLIFGPKDGRVWCHGIVGSGVLQLEQAGAPPAIREMFAEDARQFDEPPWIYFRDRVSYAVGPSWTMHVAIKLVSKTPELRYRVEVSESPVIVPEADGVR